MGDDGKTDQERLESYQAQRDVNDKIERLAATIVKRGYTPEYVGATLLGAGADMLVRTGVDVETVLGAIKKSFDDLEKRDCRTAFPDILPRSS